MLDHLQPNYDFTPVSPARPSFDYRLRSEEISRRVPPVVSLITPFFNTGPIFHQTARSVLNQSLRCFEWIIINDGSTDPQALKILDHYRHLAADPTQNSPSIRIIDHRVNLGLAGARNTGFRNALAELVFQLDSDDLIEPTTLEKCAWRLHTHPAHSFVKGKTVGFGYDTYRWEKGFHNAQGHLENNLVTATAMIRRSVWQAVGGYDESNHHGLEDWDFWLHCAESGHWGGTINEFLDWYRRCPQQHERWNNLGSDVARAAFLQRAREYYPRIFSGFWPGTDPPQHAAMHPILPAPPFENPLAKSKRRLLMVIPWMRLGGADCFNLDLVQSLTQRPSDPWEVSIAATMPTDASGHSPVGHGNEWLGEFSKFTPDIFILSNYVPVPAFPAFLEYLIKSRDPDAVLITNSSLCYTLLPYLRARCPGPAFLDFNHMEEPHWKDGGHPRAGAAYRDQLDLCVTSSKHVRKWMIARGCEPHRIHDCYTCIDTNHWKPDPAAAASLREQLRIAPQTRILLYPARLSPQKQPLLLAQTIIHLRELLDPEWRTRTDQFEQVHGVYDDRLTRFNQATDAWNTKRVCLFKASDRSPDQLLAALGPEPDLPLRPDTPFIVLVAGDGEMRHQFEHFCHSNRLAASGHIFFLGPVPIDAMRSHMAAADILFLPSQWEGIALSIYEAMSVGVPVVSADVGGQRELVTSDTGILLPGPDQCKAPELESLAYAYTLAALLTDAQRHTRMGHAARQRVQEHFELSVMRNRMIHLIDSALTLHKFDPRPRVPDSLAVELATQAIENYRLENLCEWLYRRNIELTQLAQRASDLPQPPQSDPAFDELLRIENSRSWKTILRIKQLPPYQALARMRWGPDWQSVEAKEPADIRLHRIKSSRSYQLIQIAKRTLGKKPL